MKILLVASEMAPYAKTGGLGDVVGALPKHLRRLGHEVRVIVPLYDAIDTRKVALTPFGEPFAIELGAYRHFVRIYAGPDDTFFIYCPELYHRGRLYTSDPDEHRRFLVLSYAALMASQRMGFAPDVIHCNDWQTALLPLILKVRFAWDRLFAQTKTLLSIHNLGYQGVFGAHVLGDTGLAQAAHLFHQDQLHQPHAGRINFMLHGILYANGISTVSPTYAREIQTPEQGFGLDPFLRARASSVVGILNGIDEDEWDPAHDPLIPFHYSVDNLEGKAKNKEALLSRMGLPYHPNVPLLGVVSRFAGQKGLDLLGEVLPELFLRREVQLVALGSGDSRIEQLFAHFARRYPTKVAYYRGFSNELAHLIEAGADIFVMPSRYEPCGLNQMYSLAYGTVPVVHKTGGLADTVETFNPHTLKGDGFAFEHFNTTGLRWALTAALDTYGDKARWRQMMRNGMSKDLSWPRQAQRYELAYRRLRSEN